MPDSNGSGRRSRIDPLVFRVGVGAAAITLLVVWQLLGSHFEEEGRKKRLLTEQGEKVALERAMVDRKRMTAENAALEVVRQKIMVENQRLTTELARANETIARAAEEKAELERRLSRRGDTLEAAPRIP